MEENMEKNAYVCVLTNQRFYPGLCALQYSLRKVNAQYPLYVIVPDTADTALIDNIKKLDLSVITLPNLDVDWKLIAENPSERWNSTFFKLQIFTLTQFEKIVFIDLDMIVLGNIDVLFQMPHMSGVAAGNCAHPDWTRLNSGLMVIEPDLSLYNQLITYLPAACNERLKIGAGFGDQDVINYYYHDWWHHKDLVLPEIYNAVTYDHDFEIICKQYGYQNLRVIHYAEPVKPWQFSLPQICKVILGAIRILNFNRARICGVYWSYVRKSCPEHLMYH